MPFFARRSDTLAGDIPLKYVTGAEVRMDIVVDYTTITANSDGQRVVDKGELLCRITATDKFGPYLSTETDGRQTVSAPANGTVQTVIAGEQRYVTLGDGIVGGYYHNCVFDLSLVEAASEAAGIGTAALVAAFPTCTFDD